MEKQSWLRILMTHDVLLNVLEKLSFQELVIVLSEDRRLLDTHGLSLLWLKFMDRYDPEFSPGKSKITWEYVEEHKYKIRCIDLYLTIREQGSISAYDKCVKKYVKSEAFKTCLPLRDPDNSIYGYRYSRAHDLWCRMKPHRITYEFVVDEAEYNAKLLRRILKYKRMLPRVDVCCPSRSGDPNELSCELRPKYPPLYATIHEVENDSYWEYW